jgi:serpin B
MSNVARNLLCPLMLLGLFACGSPANEPLDPGPPERPGPPGPDLEPPGALAQSALERATEPDVSTEALAVLTAGNRDFAFDLFAALLAEAEDDDNLFVSPHSISVALAMAYIGADGQTRAEMHEALRFALDDDALHAAFNALALELARRSELDVEEGDTFTLEIINQAWGQLDFPIEAGYLDTLALHYGAGLRLVNFIQEHDEVREAINEWVESVTRGRIVDLLPQGSINRLTRFVLVNAIYFYGSWVNAFEERDTRPGPFKTLDGGSVTVDLMRQTHAFGHFADSDTVAVRMPYVGNQVSMIAFMPADPAADFRAWEASLSRSELDRIVAGLRGGADVDLTFPKFESESSLSLVSALELLGMQQAFDSCTADFRGMTGADPCIPLVSLYITDILHKSFVSVDEEGTEAAAATAVIFGTTDATVPERVVVRFDRPFYYAIYDHPSETILFLGRLVDPS